MLLLEAGPYYPTTEQMPDDLLNGNDNSYCAHDWDYRPRPTHGGRIAPYPAGRVVGGSSAVNTAIALRGTPEDYDEWAALGNDEWSWEKVLPYFRRLENDQDFDDDFHGRNGPHPHPPLSRGRAGARAGGVHEDDARARLPGGEGQQRSRLHRPRAAPDEQAGPHCA